MLHFASADAEGQRAERSMCRSVRIAAHDGRPRQGKALFGSDHVHYALADVVHAEECDAEVTAILLQRLDLFRTEGIGDAQGPVGGRDVVIRHRQRGTWTSRPAARELESFKRLRRCHFVDQLTIDIEQSGPVRLCADDVGLPDFFEEGLSGHGDSSMIGHTRKGTSERRPHYTESSYGLYKSAHHILALTERTWYHRLAGCSKRLTFSPAQPWRAETRLVPSKAAASEVA